MAMVSVNAKPTGGRSPRQDYVRPAVSKVTVEKAGRSPRRPWKSAARGISYLKFLLGTVPSGKQQSSELDLPVRSQCAPTSPLV